MFNKNLYIALILGLFLGLSTASAQQQVNIEQKINEANEAYQNAYFDLSLDILEALHLEEASDADLIKVYYLKGTILMAMGEQAKAERNFQQILAINPDYELRGQASPKVRKFFATEKERAHKIQNFTLRDRVAVLQDSGTFLELTTAIINLKVELHILIDNANGLKDDLAFDMVQNSNGYIAEIPVEYSPTLAKQNFLSYYLLVTTKSGAVFKIGSVLSPKTITLIVPGLYSLTAGGPQNLNDDPLNAPVPDNKKKKKLALGLGIGIGGAVVVAAIVTAIVLSGKTNEPSNSGYGKIKLQVEAP